MTSRAPVIVVGAGIMGASVAYHLAALERDVVLVDRDVPASGATRHSFGWIGRSADSTSEATHLRDLARQDWHRLGEEIPDLRVNWSGALTWGTFFSHDGAPTMTGIGDLEPSLRTPPHQAQVSMDDGWVDPVDATEQLIAAAHARGAQLRFGSPVRRLAIDGGALTGVETDESLIAASAVVIAAGTGSSALCASVGVELPLTIAPAVMVELQARPGLITHIIANDEYEIRQDGVGRILMPCDYAGETSSEDLRRTGEQTRRLLVESIDGAEHARILSTAIGWRPMPADGDPVVGFTSVAGMYIAVAHPGVALASTLGRLAAEELTFGDASPVLTNYRPSRFDA